MSIFIYIDYRRWIKDWLKKRPNKGRGELTKMAARMGVNSTLVSQVFKGSREFTLEQGFVLCDYFNLNALEAKYFMQLLQIEKAGTHELKKYFEGQRDELRKQSEQIKNRVKQDREMTDAEKSLLVSSWHPTALLVYCGKAGGVTLEDVTTELGIEISKAKHILEMMVEMSLLQQEGGRFSTGMGRLHIPKGSPYITRHYTNWRLRAIEKADDLREESELMYTSVSSISESDIPLLKEKILGWLSEYAKSVSPSPAEKVVCLNVDFFSMIKKQEIS